MDPGRWVEEIRGRPDTAGVLLDFDGTLSPIVERPELARIVEGAREQLARIADVYALVGVISGRPSEELESLVGVPGVRLVGSYGLVGEAPVPGAVLRAADEAAADVPGAWVERKGITVAVHYRGAALPDAPGRIESRLEAAARDAGMELAWGKRVVEVVPAGRGLKQEAVRRIARESSLRAVGYAGDDLADVGAFRALDELAGDGVATLKVAVRGPETPPALVAAADHVVEGPAGLVELLRGL